MTTRRKTNQLFGIFCALLLIGSIFAPATLLAAMPDVSATPAVIDGKGKIREILRYAVTLENTSKHVVSVYPWVTDVDTAAGSTGVSDLGGSIEKPIGVSLARWIEVTRGAVDLLPGEKKEIPLTVQINLNAKPGMYHAAVHLSQGSDRASAESGVDTTQDVAVNIEVLEDVNERLQLATFAPTQNIFSNKTALFSYRLENVGNRGEVPRGKVRIFDRNGREVAVIEANDQGTRLEPEASAMLSSVWAAGGSFGRYKAMLDLEYGGRGTIQDTVFFWMVPWGKLLGMFLTLMLLSVIIAVILHSRATADRRRLQYAPAHTAPAQRSSSRVRSLLGEVFGQDEGRNEDDPQARDDAPEAHTPVVQEMREVTYPRPVRSRLPAITHDYAEGTVLPTPPSHKDIPHPSHRVTLHKQEKPVPSPHHVLNLRK